MNRLSRWMLIFMVLSLFQTIRNFFYYHYVLVDLSIWLWWNDKTFSVAMFSWSDAEILHSTQRILFATYTRKRMQNILTKTLWTKQQRWLYNSNEKQIKKIFHFIIEPSCLRCHVLLCDLGKRNNSSKNENTLSLICNQKQRCWTTRRFNY